VIVTVVPPAVEPADGDTVVTAGGVPVADAAPAPTGTNTDATHSTTDSDTARRRQPTRNTLQKTILNDSAQILADPAAHLTFPRFPGQQF
jgi:hypothetical protein